MNENLSDNEYDSNSNFVLPMLHINVNSRQDTIPQLSRNQSFVSHESLKSSKSQRSVKDKIVEVSSF